MLQVFHRLWREPLLLSWQAAGWWKTGKLSMVMHSYLVHKDFPEEGTAPSSLQMCCTLTMDAFEIGCRAYKLHADPEVRDPKVHPELYPASGFSKQATLAESVNAMPLLNGAFMQKSIGSAMVAIAISIALSACQKQSDTAEKGPAERVGAQVDAATAKAAEGLNKAGEKAGQALQSGGQKAGEAIQQGGEKLEGAAKDAQKKE